MAAVSDGSDRMADDTHSRTAHPSCSVTIDDLARLATRQLTTAQLVDLIGRLELEVIARSTPPTDYLVEERPRMGRFPRYR